MNQACARCRRRVYSGTAYDIPYIKPRKPLRDQGLYLPMVKAEFLNIPSEGSNWPCSALLVACPPLGMKRGSHLFSDPIVQSHKLLQC